MDPVQPNSMNVPLLTAILAQFYSLVDHIANIGLIAQPFTPADDTTKADCEAVKATFDGYAPKALTMSAITVNPVGDALSYSQLLSWVPSGAVTENTIYGVYWYQDDQLLGVQLLSSPVYLKGSTTSLNAVLTVSEPFDHGINVIA